MHNGEKVEKMIEKKQNRHEAYELIQMQSLPLEAKIRMTEQRIRIWHEAFDGEVYVSFSGGKDSTVLLDLCRRLYPDIEAAYSDTGLEYPEIRQFVKEFENVTWIRPEKNFRQIILERGYPVISKEVARAINYARKGNTKSGIYFMQKLNGTLIYDGKKSMYNMEKWKFLLDAPFKIDSSCCDVMKKRPFHKYEKETGKKPILGTMASESRLRKQKWIQHGCNAFNQKRPVSQPMSFWTEQDVLQYLVKYKVPYCSVYGDIVESEGKLTTTKCNRTGCMFCMFGCHLEKESRFQRMKESHPKQYEYCMKPVDEGGLGMKEVLDYINVKY